MSSKTKQTIRSVQISKAKSSLNSLVKRVHRDHEYLILKDNGTPLAAVMDIDEFEDYLELNDPKVRRDIEQSTKEFREGKGRPAREFLAELEAEATQARNYIEPQKEEIPLARNKQTIRAVPISKAKISLNSLVKRVHRDKEYLVLKENGT